MSMRDYAVNDYGLLLDEETMKIILSSLDIDILDEDEDIAYILYDEGICDYIGEFTGEAMPLTDDGIIDWVEDYECYNSEPIAYIQISNQPTLFKKSYSNMAEIVDEFKGKIGEYLPEGFNYRDRIRCIVGTYYG